MFGVECGNHEGIISGCGMLNYIHRNSIKRPTGYFFGCGGVAVAIGPRRDGRVVGRNSGRVVSSVFSDVVDDLL